MTRISLGDMAQAFSLRRQTAALKLDAQTAAREVSTGIAADTGRHLNGNMMPIAGLRASLSQLSGYAAATRDAGLQASATQSILTSVGSLAGDLTQGFVTFGIQGDPTLMDARLAEANQRFESVVGLMNTRSGGRTVMAGQQTDGPALAAPETILAALEAEIAAAGAVTPADLDSVVTAWFASPTGFAQVGYLGGAPQVAVRISATDRADQGLTAADPTLRDTLKNLAIGALMHRGALAAPAERQDMAQRLGAAMLRNDAQRVTVQAGVGLVQGRIEQVTARNAAEQSGLELQQSDLLGVDPYEAATRMEAAQSQLETLYAITARLSRLNLVDFLR